uniref:Uncharacterized protein n=1 Tax=Rhizophagus irregularis (strain DAOM 181602 / DAOM 197198 / MUCL 43194) TaxID=747089 RepID=U9T839_RHIID
MMLIGKLNIYEPLLEKSKSSTAMVKFIDYSTSFVPNCERDESITKKSLRLGSVSAIKFREIDFKVITRSLINTIIRIDKIEIKKKIMAIKRKYPRKKNLVPSRSSRFSKIPDKFQDNDDQTTKAQDKRSDTRIFLSSEKLRQQWMLYSQPDCTLVPQKYWSEEARLEYKGWHGIIELSQGSWNGGSRHCFPSAEQKYWSEEAKAGIVLSNFHKEAGMHRAIGMVDQEITSMERANSDSGGTKDDIVHRRFVLRLGRVPPVPGRLRNTWKIVIFISTKNQTYQQGRMQKW